MTTTLQWWYALLIDVPSYGGVYSVFAGDVCIYIGRGQNLRKRLKSHEYRSKFHAEGATHVRWVHVPHYNARCIMEYAMIAQHCPKLNQTWQPQSPRIRRSKFVLSSQRVTLTTTIQ